MSSQAKPYRLTTLSCFVGIFIQSIICNITALLFIPFMSLYSFTYTQLGALVTINFISQLAIDILFSKAIDKVGFKNIVVPSCILAFVGLTLFAFSPFIFNNIYLGIIISTIIFASSSGLLEITLSPIVDSIPHPENEKAPAMTLMHSFYAWGMVATIIITTVFLFVFSIEKWQILILFFALIPVINVIMFSKSRFPSSAQKHKRLNGKTLFRSKFYIVALFAILFGGATEVIMSQWSSTYMEKVLELPKIYGDLLGMCGFAVMMGLGRTLYGIYGSKIKINNMLVLGSLLSVFGYIVVALSPFVSLNIAVCCLCGLFASLLWPGVISITSRKFPLSGSFLFAILAAAGDIGAGVGPWITGIVTDTALKLNIDISGFSGEQSAIRIGILFVAIFPIGAFLSNIYLRKNSGKPIVENELKNE